MKWIKDAKTIVAILLYIKQNWLLWGYYELTLAKNKRGGM